MSIYGHLLESSYIDSNLEKCISEIHNMVDRINIKYHINNDDNAKMKKCNSISRKYSDDKTEAYKVFFIMSDDYPDGDEWADKVYDDICDSFERICKKYHIEFTIDEEGTSRPSLTGYIFSDKSIVNETFKDMMDGAPYQRGELKRLFDNLLKKKAKIKKQQIKSNKKSNPEDCSISTILTKNSIVDAVNKIYNSSKWNSMIKSELSKVDDYDLDQEALPSFTNKIHFYNVSNNKIEFSCWDGNQDEAIYCEDTISKFASEIERLVKKENKFVSKIYSLSGEDHSDIIEVEIKPISNAETAEYIADKINIILKSLLTSEYKKAMANKLNDYSVEDVEGIDKYTVSDLPTAKATVFDYYDNYDGIIEVFQDASQDERIALCYVLRDIIKELEKLPELCDLSFGTGDGDEGCIYY